MNQNEHNDPTNNDREDRDGLSSRPRNSRNAEPAPQRVPPLPASKFTRFVIDYVGDGRYQLCAQGRGEVPKPLAASDDPRPMIAFARQVGEAGDEVVLSPMASLVQIAFIPPQVVLAMQAAGTDPFDAIGRVHKIPTAEELKAIHRKVEDALGRGSAEQGNNTEAGKPKDSDEATGRQLDKSANPARPKPKRPRIVGHSANRVPEPLRRILDRDTKSGGRLGWIFEARTERGTHDGGPEANGDGPPPEAN
jgi:hypothetical protein